VSGVEDYAGNAVVLQTTQFMTGMAPDTTRPKLVRRTPESSATDVPVNTVIMVEVDEPIDALTVDNTSVVVRDTSTGQPVEGEVSVRADGRQISFVPAAPLAMDRSHSVNLLPSIRDLAANALLGVRSFNFITASTEDTTGPQLVGVNPANGLIEVPTNVQVMIAFDEPIQSLTVDRVTLNSGSGEVMVLRTLSNDHRMLILTPLVPLESLTLYTVMIEGVRDLANNDLPTIVTTSFTTGTGIDLLRPTVMPINPPNQAVGVPRAVEATVEFSERINPLTVTPNSFFLDRPTGERVPGTVSVAADGLRATFTPGALLEGGMTYRVRVLNSIADLAGQRLPFNQILATFTTTP